jgi:DnaK suppressor protein
MLTRQLGEQKVKKTILDQIKLKLSSEKEQILSKLSKEEEVDAAGDETDQIQANILANIGNSINTRDKEKLKRIDITLKKIENKCFGICVECEEKIEDKRLLANPYCARCISCAEKEELLSKRH